MIPTQKEILEKSGNSEVKGNDNGYSISEATCLERNSDALLPGLYAWDSAPADKAEVIDELGIEGKTIGVSRGMCI